MTDRKSSAPQARLKTVPIEKLRLSPLNVRRDFVTLEGLRESIREMGLLQPILVRPAGDGFEVVAGHRRFRACQAAGVKEVPVVVADPLADDRALAASLSENLHRLDLAGKEKAEAAARLLESGMSKAEAARILGVSRAELDRWLYLTNSSRALRAAVERGRISASDAAEVAIAVQDPRTQERIARVAGHMPRESIRSFTRFAASNPEVIERMSKRDLMDFALLYTRASHVKFTVPDHLKPLLLDYLKRHGGSASDAALLALEEFLRKERP